MDVLLYIFINGVRRLSLLHSLINTYYLSNLGNNIIYKFISHCNLTFISLMIFADKYFLCHKALYNFWLFLFCVWVFCLSVCLCNTYVHSCRGQKRAMDLLERELWTVVNSHVGDGNPTWVLCKSSQYF